MKRPFFVLFLLLTTVHAVQSYQVIVHNSTGSHITANMLLVGASAKCQKATMDIPAYDTKTINMENCCMRSMNILTDDYLSTFFIPQQAGFYGACSDIRVSIEERAGNLQVIEY